MKILFYNYWNSNAPIESNQNRPGPLKPDTKTIHNSSASIWGPYSHWVEYKELVYELDWIKPIKAMKSPWIIFQLRTTSLILLYRDFSTHPVALVISNRTARNVDFEDENPISQFTSRVQNGSKPLLVSPVGSYRSRIDAETLKPVAQVH